MRRAWLLFLVLVLPLQMTWAAVHGYADGADAVGHASMQVHAQAGVAADADLEAGQQAQPSGDGCCDVAQSCHGSPMLPTRAFILVTESGVLLNPSGHPLLPQVLARRHERPQWAPA